MIHTDELGRSFDLPVATPPSTATLASHVNSLTTLSTLLSSSIGPNGLDKVILSKDDDLTVTNDGATIMKFLEKKDPISRVVVELSEAIDEEIGDGTTSVVLLASALLREAANMVEKGVHPISVCNGFETALQLVVEHLLGLCETELDAEHEIKIKVAKTSLNSKIVNKALHRFAEVCVEAVECVIEREDVDFEKINIESKIGKDLGETKFFNGILINKEMSHAQMKKEFKNCRIALLSCPFEPPKLKTKNDVLIKNVEDYKHLENYEKAVFRKMIEKLKSVRTDVVLCQWGFDHEANSLLLQEKIGAVRWVSGNDMEKIAVFTNAKIIARFEDLREEDLGTGSVKELHLGGDNEKVVVIENEANKKAGTILVRGANDISIAEAKRALNDALCAVRNVCVDPRIVYGGGSADLSCANFLQKKAKQESGLLGEAFLSFSRALEEIPIQLARNSGFNALQYISELKVRNGKDFKLGVDCGCGEDMKKNGVFESVIGKQRMFEMATQLVLMILRIEGIVVEN